MKIISEYIEAEDKNFKNFICKLDKNTSLILSITEENKLKITMKDDVSEIIDICAKISLEDVNALIKTLRTVFIEMEKTNNDNKCY